MLNIEEVDKTVAVDDEVMVTVCAISVNAWDWHSMRAKPYFARIAMGLLKPKIHILGADVAGIVEAVGPGAKMFLPGDEVFGDVADFGGGGFAEYVSTSENAFTLKPANVPFEVAATVPLAALTALQGLRDKGHIQAGHNVLINGASGGVGTFAVQIAKSFGTEVTAVCSTGNLEMARSIGADHVIDYTQEDFTRNGQTYDLILDGVANRSVLDIKRALSPGGICATVGFTSTALLFQTVFLGPLMLLGGNKKIGLMVAKMKQDDLDYIRRLIEAGKVAPVIDKKYPLTDVAEAIRYVEDVHAQGKVAITV